MNGVRKDSWTPLACAAGGGQAEICDFFLQKGARINEAMKENVSVYRFFFFAHQLLITYVTLLGPDCPDCCGTSWSICDDASVDLI